MILVFTELTKITTSAMVRWLDLHFSGWPVALVSAGGKIDKTADAEPYLGKLGVRAWSGWAVCGPGKRRRCWPG